jgi:drug/metabolite transporter (DMT)-like permease
MSGEPAPAPTPAIPRRGAARLAPLVLVAANLAWGSGYPATAVALRALSPALLAALRLGVGGLALVPVVFRSRAGERWDARTLLWALGLGVAGFGLPVYLQIVGLQDSSPALAAIFVALEPLLTAAVAAAWLREPLPAARRWALALAAFGAWATAGFPRPGAAAHLLGDLLLLAANLGFSAYNALAGRLAERLSAPRATAATMLAGLLGVVPVWLADGGRLPARLAPSVVAAVLFLTLPGTAGAYLAWTWAVTQVPVAAAALFLYLQPVTGVVLSVVLTRAWPALSFYVGTAAIAVALALGARPALDARTRGDPA